MIINSYFCSIFFYWLWHAKERCDIILIHTKIYWSIIESENDSVMVKKYRCMQPVTANYSSGPNELNDGRGGGVQKASIQVVQYWLQQIGFGVRRRTRLPLFIVCYYNVINILNRQEK